MSHPLAARPWLVVLVLALPTGLAGPVLAEEPPARARLHQIEPVAAAEANERAEIRVGREVAARILARHSLHPDEALQRYVNRLGVALALHGERPGLDFHFGVIESDQVNAYAAPGGYIFITTAALALMEDEAELAAVLAHEIAHVDRRHIVEALGIRAPESSPMAGLTRFFGGATEVAQVFFAQAVEEVLAVLFEDGLQREDEFQADRDGLLLASRAGYDPGGLARFLHRMAAMDSARAMDEMAHTHPATGERLDRLNSILEQEGLGETQGNLRQKRFQRYAR